MSIRKLVKTEGLVETSVVAEEVLGCTEPRCQISNHTSRARVSIMLGKVLGTKFYLNMFGGRARLDVETIDSGQLHLGVLKYFINKDKFKDLTHKTN